MQKHPTDNLGSITPEGSLHLPPLYTEIALQMRCILILRTLALHQLPPNSQLLGTNGAHRHGEYLLETIQHSLLRYARMSVNGFMCVTLFFTTLVNYVPC